MRSAFPSRSSRSTVTVVLTAFLTLFFAFSFALVTSVISAAPAAAHAALVKVTPAANGRLNSAPTEVALDFNEPMNSKFATVVVTSAAGVSVAQGKPVVLDSKVTQALSSNLAPGGYRVAFRVTSDDGHPVTGQSTFTLTLAPGSAPPKASAAAAATPGAPVAASPSGADRNASQDSWLSRYLVPVSGALGLLVIGLGALAWERRRR